MNKSIYEHAACDRASCRATLEPLFAQVEWLRGYDLKQSTRLKLIPYCPAGLVIRPGNSGLSAPDYFCPAIIGENLEATDARWLWMDCYISYIFCTGLCHFLGWPVRDSVFFWFLAHRQIWGGKKDRISCSRSINI